MTRSFEDSLDKAIGVLYRHSYAPTITAEKEDETGVGWFSPESLKEYIRGIHAVQLGPDIDKPLAGDTPSRSHANYAYRQLIEDGYIEAGYVEDLGNEMVSLTNKGRLFHEAGGYRRSSRSLRWTQLWTRAKTIAAAINAVTIIILALWAAQSADADRLQDETIVRLDSTNAVLTRANASLESENRRLLRLILEQGSDSARFAERP